MILAYLIPPAIVSLCLTAIFVFQAYTRPESMLMVPGILEIVLLPWLFAIFGSIHALIIMPLSKLLSRITTTIWAGLLFAFILAVISLQLPSNLGPAIPELLQTHHRPGILNIHELIVLPLPVFFMACCGCYAIFKRRKKDTDAHSVSDTKIFLRRAGTAICVGLIVVGLIFIWHWNNEPEKINVTELRDKLVDGMTEPPICGDLTVSTLITVAETLIDKPGGYLSNDMLPPGVMLKDMHHWEFGVLMQIRDLTTALRDGIGYKRTYNKDPEDPDLIIAAASFKIDETSWRNRSMKIKIKEGIRALSNYRNRLGSTHENAHFNTGRLRTWLNTVEHRTAELYQNLSMIPLHDQTLVFRDSFALNTPRRSGDFLMITPLSDLDNPFYETYGSIWALSAITQAIENDFEMLIAGMDATDEMLELIGVLESIQTKWSSPILTANGMDTLGHHIAGMEIHIKHIHDIVGKINFLFRSHGHAIKMSDFTRCRDFDPDQRH